jgi:phi13 family phage major tail protein
MLKKVKEKFGMTYGVFAPIASEPDAAAPVYGAGVDMGAMSKASLTTTTTKAPLYGSNSLALTVDKFVSGELSVENLLDDLENAASFYGSTYTDGELVDNKNDEPIPGGFGYIKTLIDENKVTHYRAVWLYKVQAQMADDSAETMQDKIAYANNTVKFSCSECNSGDWRAQKDFYGTGAEAAAMSWIEAKRGGAATYYTVLINQIGTGSVSPTGQQNVADGSSLEISFGATDPSILLAGSTNVTAGIVSHKYTVTPTANTVVTAIFEA